MTTKQIFFTVALCLIYTLSQTMHIETERTIWTPWTIEHTKIWENYELLDTSASQFRRNEYFEDINKLIQRDAYWETFCNLLQIKTGASFIFPALGFAILDKTTNELIGTVRFTISSKKNYLSLGYGLSPSVRHQKLGSEIIAQIIQLVNHYYIYPIASLKKNKTKTMFMAEWYQQGQKEEPNFNILLDYFDAQTAPLQGITAFVDINNKPSLNILYRHGMNPIEIECTKYYVQQEPHCFCFNILLIYPTITTNQPLNKIVQDLLSRDSNLIQKTEAYLNNTFNIPIHWVYLHLNREEKALLKLLYAKIIDTESLSDITRHHKTTIVHNCFIK